jgi:uncharacterized protein (DUF1697 family)
VGVDSESVLEGLKLAPEIDRVIYVPGAVLWSYDRQHAGRSGMNKIIGTKFYSSVTVRNVNTARKIYSLMKSAAEL